MRNGRRKLIIASAAFALVFLLWLLLASREPVHEGKTLSAWLSQYHTNRWPLDKEAEKAIRHFGTNATPVLLKMMSQRESPLKIKLLGLVPKQLQARFHVQTPNEYRNKIGDYRRVGANGFMALGEQ